MHEVWKGSWMSSDRRKKKRLFLGLSNGLFMEDSVLLYSLEQSRAGEKSICCLDQEVAHRILLTFTGMRRELRKHQGAMVPTDRRCLVVSVRERRAGEPQLCWADKVPGVWSQQGHLGTTDVQTQVPRCLVSNGPVLHTPELHQRW